MKCSVCGTECPESTRFCPTCGTPLQQGQPRADQTSVMPGDPLEYRQPSQEFAAQRAGATVVNPLRWLCAPAGCPVIVGNTLVYKDNSHLTDAFVRAIAPLLGRKLFSGAAGGG